MRKIAALVVCLMLLLSCAVSANATAVLHDKTLAGTENTFTVDITLENEAAMKAAAITDVTYDTDRFTLVKGEWILLSRPYMDDGYYPKDEVPMAVMAYEEETVCEGSAFRLTFKIKSGAKAGTSEVGCTFMVDDHDNKIEVKKAAVTMLYDAPGLSEPVQIAIWVVAGLAVAAGVVVVVVLLRRKKTPTAEQ